ncbi:hypothetical protein LPJ61_005353, partial [Coemansia biformis]
QPRNRGERVGDEDSLEDDSESIDNFQPDPVKQTNMGLAISVGCVNLVKTVTVKLNYRDHQLCGPRVLMEMMSAVGSTLPAA